ncbi:MAG: hypothetical protein JXR07_10610 [Reichenbachiella sp.]
MKKYINISLLFALAICFVNCSDDAAPADPLAELAEAISGTHEIADEGVSAPASATTADWSEFELTIAGDETGGTFTASGVPADGVDFTAVWPASTTWTFNEDGTKMLRSDGVEITLGGSIEDGLATLSFSVTQPAAKSLQVGGDWMFSF